MQDADYCKLNPLHRCNKNIKRNREDKLQEKKDVVFPLNIA
jgi:hypothetical protein